MCPKILNQDFLGSVQHTSVFLLISPHCAFFICSYPSAAREKTRHMVSVVGLSNVLLIFFTVSCLSLREKKIVTLLFLLRFVVQPVQILGLCAYPQNPK